MSERKKLDEAHILIAQGKINDARKILENISSGDPRIRLDVILSFLVVYDHVTENDKLIELTNEGLAIAKQLGKDDVYIYLLSKKSIFILTQLSFLIGRQKNLMLSASVFEWIDFSLEKDKKEFEAISKKRKEIKQEAESLIVTIINQAECGSDHYFRGHLFSAIGDFYSSKYFIDMLDFMKGGKIQSKLANIYFVRRWNLDLFLYDRVSRRKIRDSKEKCILYFEKSIKEFALVGKKSEEANSIYNFAVKLKSFNHFSKAKNLLIVARLIAESLHEKVLLDKIEMLEKGILDKNRHLRNYVEELGLDSP